MISSKKYDLKKKRQPEASDLVRHLMPHCSFKFNVIKTKKKACINLKIT